MNKHKLLIGVTTVALMSGLAAPSASAFDEVYWTWTYNRTDTSTSVDTSTLNTFPTGRTAVEARQIYLGDVNANADSSASVINADIPPFDASTELGHVESRASAYANVFTGGSEVSTLADVSQFHIGDADPTSGATPGVADPLAANPDYAYADKLMGDASTGTMMPHATGATATATASNATAASEARAISNTASFEVASAPATPVGIDTGAGIDPAAGYVTDAMLTANLTQLSIGDTDSTATTAVDIAGHSNLNGIDRPLASATATSIGNLGTTVTRYGTLLPPL